MEIERTWLSWVKYGMKKGANECIQIMMNKVHMYILKLLRT